MTSCAFCADSRPKFGESNGETVASVGYKGAKSGSGSKLAEVIADGCGRISLREGVAVSASGQPLFANIGCRSSRKTNSKIPLVGHRKAMVLQTAGIKVDRR